MNRIEHLLSIVAEECNEVAQRCTKAQRFGLDEVQPGQDLDNGRRIVEEYADLVGAIELLRDQPEFLPFFHNNSSWFRGMVEAKQAKIEHFLKYSAKCGTLQS